MDENQRKDLLDALYLVQSFETYWAYYQLSDGRLYSSECQTEAFKLVDFLDKFAESDDGLLAVSNYAPYTNFLPKTMLDWLTSWSRNSLSIDYGAIPKFRFNLWWFLSGVKRYLARQLGIRAANSSTYSFTENEHRQGIIRWGGTLPDALFFRNPDEIIAEASNARTIAVVGDIRHSQDLMTYAISADAFCSNIVKFINETRTIIDAHGGIFDKFTGDGFIAYFNEHICNELGKNYIDCFLSFLTAEQVVARNIFESWCKEVRKLPHDAIGLGMGADIGNIRFIDSDNHFIAVGEAIVWATRMASQADADQIAVNNLLRVAIDTKRQGTYSTKDGSTKYGDKFKVWIMQ